MDSAERHYGSRLDQPLSPRLTGLVDTVAAAMASQLAEIQVEHDLTRQEVIAVQDAMSALNRKGEAPAANDYWATDAQPRARVLAEASITAIDGRFADFPTRVAGARVAGARVAGSSLEGQPSATTTSTGRQAYTQLLLALPQPTLLNDIGQWWQRRLRRAAVLSSIPAVIVRLPGDGEAAIANREMYLLDRPPWCHGDRLLSAFELAHSDIHRYGRDRIVEALEDLLPPDLT